MQPRLASNSPYNHRWSWTPDLLALRILSPGITSVQYSPQRSGWFFLSLWWEDPACGRQRRKPEVARYPERKSRRPVRLFPFAAPFRWTVLLQLTERYQPLDSTNQLGSDPRLFLPMNTSVCSSLFPFLLCPVTFSREGPLVFFEIGFSCSFGFLFLLGRTGHLFFCSHGLRYVWHCILSAH